MLNEWDKNQKQFQILRIEEEYLLFEHLPLQGGKKAKAEIAFENIQNITIKVSGIRVLYVRRHEWKGVPCDFITPSGFVPKSQDFALTMNVGKRREILNFLASKGIDLKGKR